MARPTRPTIDRPERTATNIVIAVLCAVVVVVAVVAGTEAAYIATAILAVSAAPARIALARWFRAHPRAYERLRRLDAGYRQASNAAASAERHDSP